MTNGRSWTYTDQVSDALHRGGGGGGTASRAWMEQGEGRGEGGGAPLMFFFLFMNRVSSLCKLYLHSHSITVCC